MLVPSDAASTRRRDVDPIIDRLAKWLGKVREGDGAETRRRFLGRGATLAVGAAAAAVSTAPASDASDQDADAERAGLDRWNHRGWGRKHPARPYRDWNRHHNYWTRRGSGPNTRVAQEPPGSIACADRVVGYCPGVCGSYACENGGAISCYSCVALRDDRGDDGLFACHEFIVHDRICGRSGGTQVYCNDQEYCVRSSEYGLACSGPADCRPIAV